MELVAQPESMLDRVNRFERELCKRPQLIAPVWHYFAPGIYARQILIVAGMELVGAVHKTEHLCVVSGNINLTIGEEIKTVCGLQIIIQSLPGIKRAGQAIDDTYFTTFHATNERDLDALVAELCHSTAAELQGGRDNIQLLKNKELGLL